MSIAFNIPAGYKLVPLEPTDAIFEAFAATGGNRPDQRWTALLAVAAVDAVPGEPVAHHLNMLESCANWLESRSRCITLNIKADPVEGGGYESLMRKYAEDLRTIRSILAAASVASRAGSEPVAWMIVDEAGDVRKAKPGGKDAFPVYRESIAPAAAAEPSELTTCNCRWKGEKLVQQCTLHEAWRDAIRDWSERAKVAERQLPDRERAASLVASEEPEPMFYGRWHHGNGNLCCGSMRYFRADFDTNPAPDVREGIFDWVCTTMNAALDRWREQKRAADRAIAGEAQS